MKNNFLITFIALIVSLNIFAGGQLWPWDHGACFRTSSNRCSATTTWVYTTDQAASPCGCVSEEQLLSTNLDTCDRLDQSSCEIGGEEFYNLYKGNDRKNRIGCGCFTISQD